MFQAALHLGDVWDGDTERRPTGGDVQSSDREDQHRVSPPLVEGYPCTQGEPARFRDGWQR